MRKAYIPAAALGLAPISGAAKEPQPGTNRFRELGRLRLATEKQKRDCTGALLGICRKD
jgi:hypothetical protein